MEQLVKALYDRLESNPDLQMQLFIIMQRAIDEMHNNGIIAGLTGKTAQLVHDPDPHVRIREKTNVAKAVGKQFISNTFPVPSEGGISYFAELKYDPRFVNSITLCFQGGIEGLHMASSGNPELRLDKYVIMITSGGKNLEALKANIEQLDKMYDDISLVIMSDDKIVYKGATESESGKSNGIAPASKSNKSNGGVPVDKPEKKKGFFEKLFGKK